MYPLCCSCEVPSIWIILTHLRVGTYILRGMIAMNIINWLLGNSEDAEPTKERLAGRYIIRSLRLEAEEVYYCERYEVYDSLRLEVVYMGCPVYCAEYYGELVAVKGGSAYRLLRGARTHRWDSMGVSGTEVRLLSKEDFYSRYADAEYPQAIKEFAMYECEQYISRLFSY